jgi:hypothetical protein
MGNMGCDLHSFLEMKFDGKWYFIGTVPNMRRYELFAKLSGVRPEFPNKPFFFAEKEPPADCSKALRDDYEHWGSDAHTPTIIYSDDLKNFCKWMGKEPIHFVNDWVRIMNQALRVAEDARIILWYDN